MSDAAAATATSLNSRLDGPALIHGTCCTLGQGLCFKGAKASAVVLCVCVRMKRGAELMIICCTMKSTAYTTAYKSILIYTYKFTTSAFYGKINIKMGTLSYLREITTTQTSGALEYNSCHSRTNS